MTCSTKISRLLSILFFIFFLVSCGPSNPVDKQLNKLESIIEKYEQKAQNNKLKESDIQDMQKEVMSVGVARGEETTPAQDKRFSQIEFKMDQLETNAVRE